MHGTIQKRKTRNFLRKISISLILFGLTFVSCFSLFWYSTSHQTLLISPLGTKDSGNTQNTLIVQVQDFCWQQKLSCIQITPQDGSILITLSNSAQIILSTQKSITQQLSSLQLTINQLTIEGKQFKKLDFRFDKIVVSL